MGTKIGSRAKIAKKRKPTKKRLARSAKKRRAIKNLESYVNADGTRKRTSIERRIETILSKMGLFWVPEYKVVWKDKCRFFDFLVTDGVHYSFLIEADGAYYHAAKYRDGEVGYADLTKLQRKNVRNDKFKDSMAKGIGVPLLRFGEDEIKRNAVGVSEKIAAETRRQWSDAVVAPLLEEKDAAE